ncbi:MAG: PAS domain S-box protein [Sedimentisphaerales bacterium]|nr:PAS domain S-box protein [Sedimentisphaerales bacterium]
MGNTEKEYIDEIKKLRKKIEYYESIHSGSLETERSHEYHLGLEKLITNISMNFINLPPEKIDDGLNKALGTLGEFFQVDRCYIFLYNENITTMTNTHEWCANSIEQQKNRLQDTPCLTFPWFTGQMKNLKTVYFDQVAKAPPEAKAVKHEWETQKIKSIICVPMISGKGLVGFVGFDSVQIERQFKDDTRILLRIVGEIFANALAKQHYDEELIHKTEQLNVLLGAAERLNVTLEVETVMRELVASAMELTKAAAGTAGLIKKNKMVFSEYNNAGEIIAVDYEFEKGYGVPGWIIETRKPYITNDTEKDPHVIPEIQKKLGFYNLINIPILNAAGKLLGCFEIHNTSNKRDFNQQDIEVLQGLAGLAAVALENALLVEQQYRTNLALNLSEQRFKAIADYTYDWENWISPSGKLLWVNQGVERITGYSIKECMEMKDFPLPMILEEDKEIARKSIRQAVKGSTGNNVEGRFKRKDGSIVWVATSWQPIYDKNGVYQGHRSSIREITARKKAEMELRKSQQMLKLILDTIPTHVFWKDLDLNYLGSNSHFAKDAGLNSTEEIIGKNDFELSWHKQAELYRADDRKVIETGKARINYEEPQTWKDGTHLWLKTSKVPLRDINGNIIGILGTYEDITERKQAQKEREKLLKTLEVKNEELESIVYVSSHDLRSPLLNIQGYCSELKQSIDSLMAFCEKNEFEEEVKHKLSSLIKEIPPPLQYVKEGALRINMLLDGLLRLSRLGVEAIQIKKIDMNKIIEDILSNMNYQVEDSGVDVEVSQLAECTGDPGQIYQVFTNLLDNAIKYMDKGRKGKITITSKIEEENSIYCVQDNGIGIADSHKEKAFQIFQRLDPTGPTRGEGLGLTIVRRILDRNNGRIWVESTPGRGSCFYVSLPININQ